jgi:hypothetical protein
LRLIVSAALVVRIVSLLLFAAATAACGLLIVQKQYSTAARFGWIAALLLLIALNPTRLPFLAAGAPALVFYRGAFAAFAVLCFGVFVFVVLGIDLPHERIPHYPGHITRLLPNSSPPSLPEVTYRLDDGTERVFVDRIAPVMYPNRSFRPNEAVSVILVSKAHPRIDEPLLARWSFAAFVLGMTLLGAGLAVACHLRLSAVQP